MDIATISSILTDFGFPVAVCGVLLYYNLKESERHRDEAVRWAEVLTENTKVIEGVKQTLDSILQLVAGGDNHDGK